MDERGCRKGLNHHRNSRTRSVFRIDVMTLRGMGFVCAMLLAVTLVLAAQELPSAPQPQPSAGQKPAPASSPTPADTSGQATADRQNSPPPITTPDQADDQSAPSPSTPKQPSRIKRALKRAAPNCINLPGNQSCWDKNPRDKEA